VEILPVSSSTEEAFFEFRGWLPTTSSGPGYVNATDITRRPISKAAMDALKFFGLRGPWLIKATLALLVVVSICGLFVFCCCRRNEHRHIKLKESDETGMPPQIVGSTGELDQSNFVIGDDDDIAGFWENDDFDFDDGGAGTSMLYSSVSLGTDVTGPMSPGVELVFNQEISDRDGRSNLLDTIGDDSPAVGH